MDIRVVEGGVRRQIKIPVRAIEAETMSQEMQSGRSWSRLERMTVFTRDVEGSCQSGEVWLRCRSSAGREKIGVVGRLIFTLYLWKEGYDNGSVVNRNGDHELRTFVRELCGLPPGD